jgi:hypothetical protein
MPVGWSPCSLTGCAMARSQRRAEFLSVPSTHVLRLATRGWLSTQVGYDFVNPSAFAIPASSILVGMSLGRVQFLNRCGTTE